jgi:cell division protein FtsX
MDKLPLQPSPGDVSDGLPARAWCFVSTAFKGIRSSPFQLLLTVLTMSVGAMALGLTFFIGRGAIESAWKDIEDMMGQWVFAHSAAGPERAAAAERERPEFTEAELDELRARLPEAKFVSPIYMDVQTVVNRGRDLSLPVDGITEEVGQETMFRALRGAGFSSAGWAGMAWECMVTESALRELRLNLGEKPLLLVGGEPLRVVGMVPDPPRVDPRFQSRVIVPYAAARILWIPEGAIAHIIVGWHQIQNMSHVTAALRHSLDEIRGPNTYYLSSSQLSVQKSKDLVGTFIVVGAAQAFFCILVASIGVLNVMLTNVTRRAHEFSIRIAMGASRREVLGLVLFESAVISGFGGLLGVAAAVALAPHLSGLLAARVPQASLLTALYCREGFVYPLLVCGLCGLLAGVLPALRAGRLDVLAALRAEA